MNFCEDLILAVMWLIIQMHLEYCWGRFWTQENIFSMNYHGSLEPSWAPNREVSRMLAINEYLKGCRMLSRTFHSQDMKYGWNGPMHALRVSQRQNIQMAIWGYADSRSRGTLSRLECWGYQGISGCSTWDTMILGVTGCFWNTKHPLGSDTLRTRITG